VNTQVTQVTVLYHLLVLKNKEVGVLQMTKHCLDPMKNSKNHYELTQEVYSGWDSLTCQKKKRKIWKV